MRVTNGGLAKIDTHARKSCESESSANLCPLSYSHSWGVNERIGAQVVGLYTGSLPLIPIAAARRRRLMFNCTHMYVLCFVSVLYYSLVYVNLFPTDWIYFTCNTDFCYCTFFVHLIHAKILCIVHLFRIIYASMFLIILQNKMEKCFYSFEITYRKSSQGGGRAGLTGKWKNNIQCVHQPFDSLH